MSISHVGQRASLHSAWDLIKATRPVDYMEQGEEPAMIPEAAEATKATEATEPAAQEDKEADTEDARDDPGSERPSPRRRRRQATTTRRPDHHAAARRRSISDWMSSPLRHSPFPAQRGNSVTKLGMAEDRGSSRSCRQNRSRAAIARRVEDERASVSRGSWRAGLVNLCTFP